MPVASRVMRGENRSVRNQPWVTVDARNQDRFKLRAFKLTLKKTE
jgi:hypothetical protein